MLKCDILLLLLLLLFIFKTISDRIYWTTLVNTINSRTFPLLNNHALVYSRESFNVIINQLFACWIY